MEIPDKLTLNLTYDKEHDLFQPSIGTQHTIGTFMNFQWLLEAETRSNLIKMKIVCRHLDRGKEKWAIQAGCHIRFNPSGSPDEMRESLCIFTNNNQNSQDEPFMLYTNRRTYDIYIEVTFPSVVRRFNVPEDGDVVLICGGYRYHVSKLFLGAQSQFFKAQFSGRFGDLVEVEIQETDPFEFYLFLEKLHGEPACIGDYAPFLLQLADYFDAPSVRRSCEQALLSNLYNNELILGKCFKLALKYQLIMLKNTCMYKMNIENINDLINDNKTILSEEDLGPLRDLQFKLWNKEQYLVREFFERKYEKERRRYGPYSFHDGRRRHSPGFFEEPRRRHSPDLFDGRRQGNGPNNVDGPRRFQHRNQSPVHRWIGPDNRDNDVRMQNDIREDDDDDDEDDEDDALGRAVRRMDLVQDPQIPIQDNVEIHILEPLDERQRDRNDQGENQNGPNRGIRFYGGVEVREGNGQQHQRQYHGNRDGNGPDEERPDQVDGNQMLREHNFVPNHAPGKEHPPNEVQGARNGLNGENYQNQIVEARIAQENRENQQNQGPDQSRNQIANMIISPNKVKAKGGRENPQWIADWINVNRQRRKFYHNLINVILSWVVAISIYVFQTASDDALGTPRTLLSHCIGMAYLIFLMIAVLQQLRF